MLVIKNLFDKYVVYKEQIKKGKAKIKTLNYQGYPNVC